MNPKFRIKILSLINRLFPKSKKSITVYGRRMLNDNAEALLDYLIDNHYNNKYKINICITKYVDTGKYKGIKNIKVVTNPIYTFYSIFHSIYVFHTHGMTACAFIPSGKQRIFNLWHGSPLKSIGLMDGDNWYPQTDSYFLCASPLFADINRKCFNLSDEQIFIGSNPRNDLLFKKSNNAFLEKICNSSKTILFMPTFRNSEELHKQDSTCDFPLINESNIEEINSILYDRNIKLIIKPHPYQRHINLFDYALSNIKFITNDTLKKEQLYLYELLGSADALISDFSSVFFDYMIIDRPIGFVVEDLSDYNTNRGFTVDNPMSLMPGHKIKDVEDLKQFIDDLNRNEDKYKSERERVNKICNTYTTPDGSKRILDFLGINYG